MTLDIKEELFLHMRESHGVEVRSGVHNPRTDAKDYETLFNHLSEVKAHLNVPGRSFGKVKLPENLMDDKRFEKTAFYRWIVEKNQVARSVLNAKNDIVNC